MPTTEGDWTQTVSLFLTTRYAPESSQTKDEDHLLRVGREVAELHVAGKVSTTNPRELTEPDLIALYKSWEKRGVAVAGREKYHTVLRAFLRSKHVRNYTLEGMIDARHPVIPRRKKTRGKKSGRPLEEPVARRVIEKALEVAKRERTLEGVNRALVYVLTMAFGIRSHKKELRCVTMGELSADHSDVDLSHYKGDERNAAETIAPEFPWFEDLVEEALRLRREVYEDRGVPDPEAPERPIISKVNGTGYTASNTLAKPCREFGPKHLRPLGLSDALGKPLRWVNPRDGRTTYVYMLRERGIDIGTVSDLARHSSVVVTQAFYDTLKAVRAKKRLWEVARSATTESAPADKKKERAGGDSNPRPIG